MAGVTSRPDFSAFQLFHLLFEGFHDLLTGPPVDELELGEMGKLAVFTGVREFPMRVKCATLPWHTLKSALEQSGEVVRTE